MAFPQGSIRSAVAVAPQGQTLPVPISFVHLAQGVFHVLHHFSHMILAQQMAGVSHGQNLERNRRYPKLAQKKKEKGPEVSEIKSLKSRRV